MPEPLGMSPIPQTPDTDLSTLTLEQILGGGKRIQVKWGTQGDWLPPIVKDITANWDNQRWLEALVRKVGYEPSVYDAEKNPKGIFTSEPPKVTQRNTGAQGGISELRIFALRAAGLQTLLIQNMFVSRRKEQILRVEIFKEIEEQRRALLKK